MPQPGSAQRLPGFFMGQLWCIPPMSVTTQLGGDGLIGSCLPIGLSPWLVTLPATMSIRRPIPLLRVALGCMFLSGALGPSVAQASDRAVPVSMNEAASADAPRTTGFDVFEYEIEGNTVLPVIAVERAVTPHLGPKRTVADVEGARAALEKAYQDAGYVTVFVDLPEQEVLDGVVRLRVLEGKVSRLKVTESRYFDQGRIRNVVSELADGKVPNFNVVQAQLAEVNRTEERRVQPILRPGPVPGTVEAELKVSDQLPMSFSVELNNRQVQFTDPLRLQVTGTYSNLFQADHSLSFIGIVTPQDTSQSKALGLNYQVPLAGGDAWQASLLVSDSFVQPIGGSNVVGKGFNLSLKRLWALPQSPGVFHTLSVGVDYKNTRERITAGDASSLASPLRYMPLGLDYTAILQRGESTTMVQLSGTFALRGVLRREVDCVGPEDQFGCKREEGDGSFAAIKLDLAHTHPLWWGMDARWRLGAQASNQPLVGAEQFSIGGVDSVRGYYEAELLGDAGVRAGLELSSPNWGGGPQGSWRAALTELRLHGYLEAGQVRVQNPSADDAPITLAGAGLGLSLKLWQTLSARLDVAWPLKATTATRKGDPRVHARLVFEF